MTVTYRVERDRVIGKKQSALAIPDELKRTSQLLIFECGRLGSGREFDESNS
jgi:hypothetical protein